MCSGNRKPIPSCRRAVSAANLKVRDFAPGRAGADPAPWGIGARGWRRICSPDLFLSPPRRNRSRLRRGLCFKKQNTGISFRACPRSQTRRRHGALFAPGLSLWVFSRDTLFCLYRKVSYPAFRALRATVSYTLREECEKRAGEHRENGAGEDRDPLHSSAACSRSSPGEGAPRKGSNSSSSRLCSH